MFIEEFPGVPNLEPRETLREAALSVIIEGPVVIEILGVRTHQTMHFQWMINRGSLYYGLLCPSYRRVIRGSLQPQVPGRGIV